MNDLLYHKQEIKTPQLISKTIYLNRTSIYSNTEMSKAQLLQTPRLRKLLCAFTFLFRNIAKVALRNKGFKICCALIALCFQFLSVNSAILHFELNIVSFRSHS